MSFPRATELVHSWVQARLRAGDCAIDATAGNGHDTVFLAEIVGSAGRVHAFDLQAAAIEETERLLIEKGLRERVDLIWASHDMLLPQLESLRAQVRVIMFNLGYLPGSDKAIVTQPDTTLAALQHSLELLLPGGLISLVLYLGHPGGQDEAEAVLHFCRALDPTEFRAYRSDALNYNQPPPFAVGIERRPL